MNNRGQGGIEKDKVTEGVNLIKVNLFMCEIPWRNTFE
jgi:hypothetical protein